MNTLLFVLSISTMSISILTMILMMLSPVLLCHQAFLVRVSIRFKTPPLGGSSRLSKVAFCFLLLTRTLYLGRLLSLQRYRLLLVRMRVIQRR